MWLLKIQIGIYLCAVNDGDTCFYTAFILHHSERENFWPNNYEFLAMFDRLVNTEIESAIHNFLNN